MVAKRCPNCNESLPVACKSCSCGHVFISKKQQSLSQQEKQQESYAQEKHVENEDDLSGGDRDVADQGQQDDQTIATREEIDDSFEELLSFKETQVTFNDRLEESVADIIADQDDLKKDFRFNLYEATGEIVNLKVEVDKKLTELTETLEKKFQKHINEQDKKISSLVSQVKI